mmetsp:Transcript_40887/g.69899  ORF Transcript_40887/g.69899 Transcript_40887/m.69899 type:complete len:232 (-) Transcript_40887:62-757(-)
MTSLLLLLLIPTPSDSSDDPPDPSLLLETSLSGNRSVSSGLNWMELSFVPWLFLRMEEKTLRRPALGLSGVPLLPLPVFIEAPRPLFWTARSIESCCSDAKIEFWRADPRGGGDIFVFSLELKLRTCGGGLLASLCCFELLLRFFTSCDCWLRRLLRRRCLVGSPPPEEEEVLMRDLLLSSSVLGQAPVAAGVRYFMLYLMLALCSESESGSGGRQDESILAFLFWSLLPF